MVQPLVRLCQAAVERWTISPYGLTNAPGKCPLNSIFLVELARKEENRASGDCGIQGLDETSAMTILSRERRQLSPSVTHDARGTAFRMDIRVYYEDRCTVRTGHGPENLSALRRFAIGLILSKSRDTVASTLQRLARRPRMVLDYLRLTDNALPRTTSAAN